MEADTEQSRSEPKRSCAALRKDGQPCTAPVMGAAEWCFAHDPARAEEREDARRRGGTNSSTMARLHGLVPPRLLSIFDALEAAMTEVHDGSLDPKQAQAMASLARALVAVLTAGELEQRVRDLEPKAAA